VTAELLDRPSYLGALSRPEVDVLLAVAEQAYAVSQARLSHCELVPEVVAECAQVAQDCLSLWHDVLNESIWRLWHGEPVPAGA